MPPPGLSAAVARARRAVADPRSDGALLAAFVAARDGAAFAALVERFGPMVFAVCRRVTGHHQDAEDAFQAVFVVLDRKAGAVAPREAVGGWLYGVAVRTAREARAMAARRSAREVLSASPPDAACGGAAPDPDLAAVIDAELAALPEKDRTLLVRCDLRDEPQTAVAAALGVPVGTVYSRLAAARKRLAARLSARGVTPGVGGLAAALGGAARAASPADLSARAVAAALAPESAPAAVAALSHGVLRAMLLHKLRAVPVAVGLFAVVAFAAAPAPGRGDAPRPVVPPVRVAADPPPPKATPAPRPPVGIVVARADAVWRFDPAGKKLGELPPPAGVRFAGRVAVSPDGAWVAASGMAADVPPQPARTAAAPQPFPLKLVLLPLAGGEPRVIDMPGYTVEPVWDRHPSAAGKRLYVGQAVGPDRVDYRHPWVNLPAGTLSVPTGIDPPGLRMLDVHPDGAPFLCEQRDVEKKTAKLVLSGGGGFTELTDLKTPPGFITARFSPDGKTVLFTDGDPARKDAHTWGKSHRPYVLDVATKERTPLADFPENGQALGVAWSPDGRRVAYTWTQLHADVLAKDSISPEDARRETEGFLMVADADGRNARTLASAKAQLLGNLVFGAVDWR